MRKIFLLLLTLLVINFIVFIIANSMQNDLFGFLIIIPAAVLISLVIFIIVVIKTLRNNYVAGDAEHRKKSRKRGWIIFGTVTALLITGFIVLSFRSGYIIPESDKHADWKHFPEGSNPKIAIKALDSLYIYMMEPIEGTRYYMVHFTRDSVEFHNSNIGGQKFFGIMDDTGKFKVAYDKDASAYKDVNRIIIVDTQYGETEFPIVCDVYDIPNLTLSKANILPITITEQYDPYSVEGLEKGYEEKYIARNKKDFFAKLQGIQYVETEPVYEGNDNRDRGYAIYKDDKNVLYTVAGYNDSYSFTKLCPHCNQGYRLDESEFGNSITSANIKPSEKSIVYENHLNSGLGLGWGNTTGYGRGAYFRYYQTWLLYYTATLGNITTPFKLEGGSKDMPYTSFYQLNTVKKSTDTLTFVAENKIWQLYVKR